MVPFSPRDETSAEKYCCSSSYPWSAKQGWRSQEAPPLRFDDEAAIDVPSQLQFSSHFLRRLAASSAATAAKSHRSRCRSPRTPPREREQTSPWLRRAAAGRRRPRPSPARPPDVSEGPTN